MKNDLLIRESVSADLEEILSIYPRAFPDEELRPLVRGLLTGDYEVLSLVAVSGGALIGHGAFTNFESGDARCSLLGPLCVEPAYHSQGIGSRLVNQGHALLAEAGVNQVFVLGNPNYYGRFEFEPESRAMPPYPIIEKWLSLGAWQSLQLVLGAVALSGNLVLPDIWMNESLWGA